MTTDGIDRFFRSLDFFDGVVRQVPDGRWDSRSPCENWTAAAVVGHVVAGLGMIRDMLDRGESVAPPTTDPAVVAGTDPATTWLACRDEIERFTKGLDPQAIIKGPAGDISVDAGLGQATVEMLVHGWDLATATGASVRLPDDLVQPLLNSLEEHEAGMRASGMYGRRLEVPADATPQARLLALLGRS